MLYSPVIRLRGEMIRIFSTFEPRPTRYRADKSLLRMFYFSPDADNTAFRQEKTSSSNMNDSKFNDHTVRKYVCRNGKWNVKRDNAASVFRSDFVNYAVLSYLVIYSDL